MRRIWAYFLICLLAICSCVRIQDGPQEGSSYPEGATVTISFAVMGDGISPTKTQSLGEDEPLQNLHLAVFGSSGYLKEYVQATPGGVCGSIDFEDPYDPEKITNVPLYSYTAKLTLTDSQRIIHFIGNGPETLSFGYADAVLSSLLSFSGERAYWQMLRVDGIHAKQSTSAYRDSNGEDVEIGDYIDASGNKITNGQGYVVASSTLEKFATIPLIRNWARLVVEADTSIPQGGSVPNNPFFKPISYAIVHVPDRGTLAPHSSATGGFIEEYQKKTYLQIVGMGYPANLPPNTNIDRTIPRMEDFTYWDPDEQEHGNPSEVEGVGWRNGVAPAGQYGAVYLYERPVPNDLLDPTYVIVYGEYDNPDYPEQKGKYFYKIDLMTEGKYYPIYRNFQYRILIHSILAQGHGTPEAAAAAAGSADVSADINARHLPDISDGHRRLVIEPWMAKTFTSAQSNNMELSAYYMSEISTNAPDMEADHVTIEALPMKKGADPVILVEDEEGNPLVDDDGNPLLRIDPPDETGRRTIHFSTSRPSTLIRSQTLRVTGMSDGELLYRDIVITIQNIQQMQVRCSDRRIKSEKGTPIDLYINIPDGLSESMFPLQFLIEPEAMTLSPNNDNLPVEYGKSISGSEKSSFHFIKTLDWEEYRSLPSELDDEDGLWRRITCHFVSNRDNSSTQIWVRNNDYFSPAGTTLGNFSDKSFSNVHFVESIKQVSGHPLTLEFEVDRDVTLPEITLTLDGLIPQARTGLPLPDGFTSVSDVEYRFTPTDSHVSIPFYTADATGEVYLRLSAEDYESQSLRSHHFTLYHDVGFFDAHATKRLTGWSNVVKERVNMAKNKNVLFGYYDDPEALNPTIDLLNLDGLSKQFPKASEYPYTPTGPQSSEGDYNYHELEFKTTVENLYYPVSFVLSSPGYVEVQVSANRFRGNIFTYQNTSLKTSNVSGTPLTHTGNMDTSNPTSHKSTATFSSDFRVENNGIWLNPGETGTITFTNTNPSKYKFFYIQFNIGSSSTFGGWKRMFPKMEATVMSAGTFEKYPGSNDQCIWFLPDDTQTAWITLTPHDDYPINITGIVIKTINYN